MANSSSRRSQPRIRTLRLDGKQKPKLPKAKPGARSSSPRTTTKRTPSTSRSKTSGGFRSKSPASRFRNKMRPAPKGTQQLIPIMRKEKDTPHDFDDSLKVIPLGGLGEVGRNMQVIEYKDEIIIVDVGFGFPEDGQPGIDYTLPNTEYLKGKADKVKAIFITHGHYDHIGGLPYIITKLGNPPIYTTKLAAAIIQKRHSEFPHLPELDINLIEHKDKVHAGQHFTVEFVHVNHNIPEDLALYITTPSGTIFHTGDFKFDPEPYREEPADFDHIEEIGKRGVTLLMSDSTGADKEGLSISETEIMRNLEEIFKVAEGRIIAATFASLINRVEQMISLAEKYGRKVIIDGYSMKNNMEIMKELGEIKIKKGTEISPDQIDDYPDNQILVIGTGAQGEERAVMMRIASGNHRHIKLKDTDTAIFSSSVVPGNERSVQRLHDLLARYGVHVYHSKMMDIHASGHAAKDDLKKMIRLTSPRFLMPVHGYYYMMAKHRDHGTEEHLTKEDVIMADNGNIIHITPDEWWYDKETAPAELVMVDGLGVGDVGNVVLRDRQALAEEGMFVLVVLINGKTGQVQGSPDIISRGFVYLKDNKELLQEVRQKIKSIVKRIITKPVNTTDIKNDLREEIGLFLFKKTERRPMILPVVIEV